MNTVKNILLLLLPMISFGQTETNYHDNGQISCEIIQLDKTPDLHRHIIYYHDNGHKKEEFFDKNRMVYDTLNKWTDKGHLHSKEIHTDTGYTEIHYYSEIGQILSIGMYKLVQSPDQKMVVYDSTNFEKYETTKCDNPCYERTGNWKTYHRNGKIESEGQYLPREFEVSYPTQKDSNNVHVSISNKSFEMIPGITYIGCSTFLKDGLWVYYDENGKEKKMERYEKGLLIKE